MCVWTAEIERNHYYQLIYGVAVFCQNLRAATRFLHISGLEKRAVWGKPNRDKISKCKSLESNTKWTTSRTVETGRWTGGLAPDVGVCAGLHWSNTCGCVETTLLTKPVQSTQKRTQDCRGPLEEIVSTLLRSSRNFMDANILNRSNKKTHLEKSLFPRQNQSNSNLLGHEKGVSRLFSGT